ncbi:MAG TPA: carbohydrate kinase family protein [Desulfomonilia bacterium]
MNKPIEVLVAGRLNVDYLCVIERYPEEDTKIRIIKRISDIGGQGGNTSCCIKRLGGSLKFISRIGNDDEGRFCIELLNKSGIDTSSIRLVKGGHTTVSFVFISRLSGKRTLMYESEALPDLRLDRMMRSSISRAGVLLLDPSVTHLATELKAIKDRPPIVYDCERWREGIYDMMDLADYFVPSSLFLKDEKMGFKTSDPIEGIKTLARKVSNRLIMTDGRNGAYFIENGNIFNIRPPRVEIIDTTGAGDNFHGALALALSRNFSLKDSVKLAIAVATLSCRGYGGRAAVPEWNEAMDISKNLKAVRVCDA